MPYFLDKSKNVESNQNGAGKETNENKSVNKHMKTNFLY